MEWIKIETKDDLPKDVYFEYYHVYAKDGVFILNEKNNFDYFSSMNDNKVNEWLRDYTHYKPIEKPEPPTE